MITSPRAQALRGALLGIGAEARDDVTLKLGDLDLIIGVEALSIPAAATAPQLAERVASLAHVFRISVSMDGGPAIAAPPPQSERARKATVAPPAARIARREPQSVVDDLLANVPDLQRASPISARFAEPLFSGMITERDNIVTLTFDSLPPASLRPRLGLALVRIGARLDVRMRWLCVMLPEEPPQWLDRTLRNTECRPEGNSRAYLRPPHLR